MNIFQPAVDAKDELTFYNDVTFDGLVPDKSYVETICIPTYHPSMTLGAQIFTYALNTPLFKYEFPTYCNVIRIRANILEKVQKTFLFVVQMGVPELIAQSIW